MKKFLIGAVISALGFSLVTVGAAPANAAGSTGQSCAQEGLVRKISGLTYTWGQTYTEKVVKTQILGISNTC